MSGGGSVRLLGVAENSEWLAALADFPVKDIVHFPQYASVFEAYGDGRLECLLYQDKNGSVLYPYIVRTIDSSLQAEAGLSGRTDLITPYGYGGYVHTAPNVQTRRALLAGFRGAMHERAQELGAVSEFIRFHPVLANHEGSELCLDQLVLSDQNVILDLTLGEEELLGQCRPSFRRSIRKGRKAELTLTLEDNLKAKQEFTVLYRETMLKHGQTGYLNFRPGFFDLLAERLDRNLLTFSARSHGQIAASALFLSYGSTLDYFLGASQANQLHLHPNHFLFFEVALWGAQNGFTTLHLGGGSSSLLFFKTGFSHNRISYFTGRHIHDRPAYDALSRVQWRRLGLEWDPAHSYHPAYRYGG